MPDRLFIHATNVHQGGGSSLLTAILNTLPSGMASILSIDSRMSLPDSLTQEIQVRPVAPTIAQRIAAERWLAGSTESGDLVLCFGNLPPLFKLRGHVVVFVQNRYLVDEVKLDGFSFKTRLRLGIERLWLSSRMSNVDEFIVQTPSMKTLLQARATGKKPVRVLPFLENNDRYVRSVSSSTAQKELYSEFLYVASGEPHKNHRQLIDAWCLLAKEGMYPSLKLTLDRTAFAELCIWVEQKIEQFQLKVANVGNVPSEQAKKLYLNADALIYPSTFESFGLPLIEARQAGLMVVASELDFVRDVLDPEQTFDPESATSIARAVKRFMGIEEQVLPLLDAKEFMKQLLARLE